VGEDPASINIWRVMMLVESRQWLRNEVLKMKTTAASVFARAQAGCMV
jgi:hypothetical protein